jgi:hypothetical protein
MNVVIICLYNLCLAAGTAYLVAVYDWSGWWFLLTMCFMFGQSSITTKKD